MFVPPSLFLLLVLENLQRFLDADGSVENISTPLLAFCRFAQF